MACWFKNLNLYSKKILCNGKFEENTSDIALKTKRIIIQTKRLYKCVA